MDGTVSGCDFSGLKASVPQGRNWWSPAQFLGDFSDCSFRDADLSHVHWGAVTRIEGCDFTGAVKPPQAAEEMTANSRRSREGMRSGAVEHSMALTGNGSSWLGVDDVLRLRGEVFITEGNQVRKHNIGRGITRPHHLRTVSWGVYAADGKLLGEIQSRTLAAVRRRATLVPMAAGGYRLVLP